MEDMVLVEFNAWWLLVVPTMLIITIVILTLIVKIPPLIKKDLKKKSLTSWIEVKDLLYWLLIICLGSISLFTYQYRENSEVIDHWGFAGTIVSIILAVVAIGFTLFQTLSSNLSSEKIAESAEKIERATDSLDTETLLKSSEIMNNAATFLTERISLIEKSLLSLDTEQKRFNEIAATGFNSNKALSDNEDGYNLNKFIDEIYPYLPFYSQLFTYAYMCLNSIGIDINDEIRNELRNLINDYDQEVNGYGEQMMHYSDGAVYASEGATFSFVFSLGIIYQFSNNPQNEKDDYINKCQVYLKKQIRYLALMDEYILEKRNNK
ncbi:hypothetical protein [Lysinibacillus sp. K60]|uniref:hypothetical protein n=1 Tax=Lysinibacillus sp. K60 TaxID=2720027 RepID=UPI001C8C9A34|nr:hypothetical protein [Lysinibacillus sp. K60]MBX8942557.1 hypothetical protein [Lysinibacillus sp. K60]